MIASITVLLLFSSNVEITPLLSQMLVAFCSNIFYINKRINRVALGINSNIHPFKNAEKMKQIARSFSFTICFILTLLKKNSSAVYVAITFFTFTYRTSATTGLIS